MERSSLYDYALFRQGIEPDGRLPRGGHPLPEPQEPSPAPSPQPQPKPDRSRLTWQETQEEVAAALTAPLADPDPVRAADTVHRRAEALALPHRTVRAHVTRLPLADESAARRTARRLTRHGTSPAAVGIGLALLVRLGEPQDVPVLQTLGLLRGLGRLAAAALDPLDRRAAALLLLAERTDRTHLDGLADAVAARDPAATRTALLALPRDPGAYAPARRIAEATELDVLLRAHPRDGALLAGAARLLTRMACQRDYRAEILDYRPAVAVYGALVAGADRIPPSLDHHALLLSTALDLHSGTAALLDWPPGRREALLEALGRLLASPAWTAAATATSTPADERRADWIRRTGRRPFDLPPAPQRLRIEVVVEDPAEGNGVDTRILVDGRPLVPALFGKGPGNPPELLLDRDDLRAGPEPREVQLAEAYCSEGCCGALYATVRRDGAEVVWGEWRGATGSTAPPELRFAAAAYGAELARADADRAWSWPARSTARLIAAGLRERPELLARWECRPGWTGTAYREPDSAHVSFTYRPAAPPAVQEHGEPPWLQYFWELPDDGRPPEVQAAAALDRLAGGDPTTWSRICGGSRESARILGRAWPEKPS
ncbi:hypothetical protein [Streptomyces sp. NBC_00091]|uniref:hypothetical protein n=1 Tax=Streptomyces sp. NBC_00091 TaxID=2975648 RepID=UPI002253B6A1|nr:hypothetical protein [Streptomyces sp. NBC_00091]MCX5376628.1 hypothetical protein [Streptomyces sp. NBC_00091]